MAKRAPGFGGPIAARYDAWYATPEGRKADALEKASLWRTLESFGHVESVLEVGCGTGHFTRWLSDQGLVAAGLDNSTAMLLQAQRLDSDVLVQGDALHLPFCDGAFDLVAFITALEFLEQPRQALLEGLRVARQGLLLGVLNRHSVLGLQRRLTSLLRPTVYGRARFLSVVEVKRLLQSVAGAGTRIVWHTTLFPRCWPWPQAHLPWGAFLTMALIAPHEQRGKCPS